MRPSATHEIVARRLHAARLAGAGAALIAAAALGHVALAVVASVGLYLAAFAANHDVVHRALGLGRVGRDAAHWVLGALMLSSGHGIRVMHARHHAHPLGEGDVEGAAAHLSLPRALLASPRLAWRYRVRSVALAPRRERPLVIGQSALNLATVAALAATGSSAWLACLATLAVMQTLMPFWAGHVPHRTPPWLLRAARALAFTRSAVILSLAYHEEHHASPRVPCHRLHTLAEPGPGTRGAAPSVA